MIAGKPPAILNVPDISKMYFNQINCMGTKAENTRLRIEREKDRKESKLEKIKIWEIWKKYYNLELEDYSIEENEEIVNMIKNNLERKIKSWN